MRQEEIDQELNEIRNEQSYHRYRIKELEETAASLLKEEYKLDDPHAVIPKQYSAIDEWLKGHPFPKFVNAMKFKNKVEAFNVFISCNTYQTDYHIVRINKNENI